MRQTELSTMGVLNPELWDTHRHEAIQPVKIGVPDVIANQMNPLGALKPDHGNGKSTGQIRTMPSTYDT